MTRQKRLMMWAVTALLVSAGVQAEPIERFYADRQAFPDIPVSDQSLAAAVGTGFLPFTRGLYLTSDVVAVISLQQYGQTSRIAMDNWWAQTGAALIVNSLLERQH